MADVDLSTALVVLDPEDPTMVIIEPAFKRAFDRLEGASGRTCERMDPDALAAAVAERVVERLGAVIGEEGVPIPAEDVTPRARTRISEATILSDVAVIERAARRLRCFVRTVVSRAIEVAPTPPAPPVGDSARTLARRLLARSGFVSEDP